MAKSRSNAALRKVLEKSDTPVYLIDNQQCLAYGNAAFFQWIGAMAEDVSPSETAQHLIGARLVYSNSVDLNPLERQLCGLAPPPKLAAGDRAFSAPVSNLTRANVGSDQMQEAAHADFSFINIAPEQRYLLAVVSLTPPGESITAASDCDQANKLHTALRQLAASIETWHRCSALIGNSPYVLRLQKQVQAASQHALEFTIVGPAGSGREQLARMIMKQRQAPNVAGSDGGDLVTLHGYIADSELVQSCAAQATEMATQMALATDSRTDKTQAWLLILDADQLDATAQAELWSILQTPDSRLRILATAERDLIHCAQTDGFHPGLAHLLTTQTIKTIALQQHLSDLPLLIQYEIERCNADRQIQLSGLDAAATQMLAQYQWPGDLAELTSIITAASNNSQGNEIGVDDLPEKFRHAIAALKSPPNEIIEINLESYLSEIERKLVGRALHMAKGNKTKAAKLLGVSRAKLLRRIQHFEFEQPPPTAEDQPEDGLSPDDFRPLDEPLFEEADE